MQEYELKVLEQYEIDVKSTQRARGAFFCDTEQGLYLIREAGISEKRAEVLDGLQGKIIESGYSRIDRMVKNKQGTYVTVLEDGKKYILKQWYRGRECDVRRNRELYDAVKNLARLHSIMKMPEVECMRSMNLEEVYERHNRELRKIRSFIRGKSVKDEFELAFLQGFEEQYQWAERAIAETKDSSYDSLYRESEEKGEIVHGEYNYHNVLNTSNGIATTNFEHFKQGIQMEDLYYFLRKTMEKQEWNMHLFDGMVNAYSAIRPIGNREMEYLKLRFLYPEKFWKVAGSYYRSNKAWSSSKNIEKLQMAMKQTEEKVRLLGSVFA